jgi:hypothetical protein
MRAIALVAALVVAAPAFGADDDGGAAAAPLGPDADAPTVGASLDRTEAFIGDRLTLTVSATARGGVAVTLPQKIDLGKLELLDRDDSGGGQGARELDDGRRSHRFVLGVAAYEVGELEVPAIELTYINPRGEVRTVRTEPIALNVRGLVGSDEKDPALQPMRPARSALVEDRRMMAAARWGAVGLGALIVLGVLVSLLRRALRRARGATPAEAELPTVPRRPPDEIAIEKLRALRAAGNFSLDGYRPFAFAVAEAVREYLGARYGFESLELTTTELLEALSTRAAHLVAGETDLVRFLRDTDLIKFAKLGSTDAEALRLLDAAEAIVLSTGAQLEAAVQRASASGGAA